MQLVGSAAWPSPRPLDGRDTIEGRFEQEIVVPVGRAQETGERRALPVDHEMALRARFAAIRWVRPGLAAPFFAGRLALSSAARLQSMRSALPRRSSKARWRAFHTPASCQSRRRRQQVMPDPPPVHARPANPQLPGNLSRTYALLRRGHWHGATPLGTNTA